jgi:arylsulfatase A-like enzyme
MATEKPNILFIFVDDLGWRDTSYMGSDFYETPHIDALAAQGMIFSDAYSGAANCAPARACLLSGQYTPRHKIYNVGTEPRGNSAFRRLIPVPGTSVLNPEIRTWAQQIQAAGYTTGTFGKWHLSNDPLPYGFDVNIGGTHGGGPPQGYYPPHGKAPGLADAPEGEYITDRLSDEVIKFIGDNRDRPWLAYLTHFAVHTPLDAKLELVEKYKLKAPGKLHQHVAIGSCINISRTARSSFTIFAMTSVKQPICRKPIRTRLSKCWHDFKRGSSKRAQKFQRKPIRISMRQRRSPSSARSETSWS